MHEYPNLNIDIVERDGAVLEGEVDLCAAPEFEASLARVGAGHAKPIVVDLDQVSFMDSAGVHVLLQFALSHGIGNRLALTGGSSQVRRLLEVTGVRRYLRFVASPQLDPA
jgi:anti-sigma B factor antagonist